MCTVSWIHHPGGYELFCNRDELLTRKTATPPMILEINGVKVIAPQDGDFGGSWISVNEYGLSLSLLNLYETAIFSKGRFISRGLLLMELAECRSVEQLITRLPEIRLNRFQPFTLLSLKPGQAAAIVRWDGNECLINTDGDGLLPLTSSSFDTANVIQRRKESFAVFTNRSSTLNSDALHSFHCSHWPRAGAYSTCMHRNNAATVSFSRIKVDSGSIEFRYFPHSPCRGTFEESNCCLKTLPRK